MPMLSETLTRVPLSTGVELDVLDVGPRDAPALIFLHGFPESHRTWRHQIRHFSDRYRCIAPDQRGYRGSSKPKEVSAYTFDKLAADVFALADALGVERFTALGHDWGGAVAWGVGFAGQANGRVDRVVIANAPHPAIFQKLLHEDPEQRRASQYIRAFRDTANDAVVQEHGLTGLLAKVVKWDRPAAMEDAERNALLQDWQDRDAAMGMLNWYRAAPVEVPPMDAPFAPGPVPPVPKLTLPTLVIWAVDDLALPVANVAGLEDYVEDLTLVTVPECGHFVPWEAAEQVNAAVEGFFGRTGSEI